MDTLPPLPQRLLALSQRGVWPTHENERRQNVRPLATPERIRALAPEYDTLYLFPVERIRSIAEDMVSNGFWAEWGALSDLDPSTSLVIGDFGLGSDSPIILAYSPNATDARVLRLAWSGAAAAKPMTTWVQCAATFDEFANLLGLDADPRPFG